MDKAGATEEEKKQIRELLDEKKKDLLFWSVLPDPAGVLEMVQKVEGWEHGEEGKQRILDKRVKDLQRWLAELRNARRQGESDEWILHTIGNSLVITTMMLEAHEAWSQFWGVVLHKIKGKLEPSRIYRWNDREGWKLNTDYLLGQAAIFLQVVSGAIASNQSFPILSAGGGNVIGEALALINRERHGKKVVTWSEIHPRAEVLFREIVDANASYAETWDQLLSWLVDEVVFLLVEVQDAKKILEVLLSSLVAAGKYWTRFSAAGRSV